MSTEIVQLLARGYTREQIAAWQQACAEAEQQAEEPAEEKKPRAGRRRNA